MMVEDEFKASVTAAMQISFRLLLHHIITKIVLHGRYAEIIYAFSVWPPLQF